VKEFLSRNGYTFTVKDVDEEDDAYRELIARGYRTVPVTIVGGRTVKGFDEPALRQALADASAP
jgi:glutaredoxin